MLGIDNDIALLVVIPLIIFLAPFFSRVFKIPTICIEIFLGSVVVFLGISSDNHLLHLASEIGFIFLMFLAGLEVELDKVLKLDKRLVKPTLFYIGIIHALSIVAIAVFDFPRITITIIPLISIGVIATLKKEYGDQEWLRLSFIVGTIAEIVSIVEFSIVSSIITNGFTVDIVLTIGYLGIIILITALLFKGLSLFLWWFPETVQKLTPAIDTQEKDIRLSMIILLSCCALMMALGLEIALGAFIGGMFIRAFFLVQEDLSHKLEGFGFGFLVPLFFIQTGMSFDLAALQNLALIKLAVLLTFAMIAVRILGALTFKSIISWKNTLKLGLSHSMPLSLLIGLVTIAYNGKSIDLFHFNAFILAALLEVLISTICIKLLEKH